MLKELEGVAPSKEDYSQLCLLLTLNKLSEHPDYRSWNPVKARCNKYKYKYKQRYKYKYKYIYKYKYSYSNIYKYKNQV